MSRRSKVNASARPELIVGGYLGSRGCHVALLSQSEMLLVAGKVFGLPPTSLAEMAATLRLMPSAKRSALARANVVKHWPKPCALWPKDAQARGGVPVTQQGLTKVQRRALRAKKAAAWRDQQDIAAAKEGHELRRLMGEVI